MHNPFSKIIVWNVSQEELHNYMLGCIELAKRAPNGLKKPYVGAVVVSTDGKIIGEGYKSFVEGTKLTIHAERMALNQTEPDFRGSYLITTLEPCVPKECSQIFPACTDLIIRK